MKNKLEMLKTKYLLPAIILIIGVILIAIPTSKSEEKETASVTDISYYSSELETKLTELLLEVEGIEKANVFITLENTGKQVLAENKSSSSAEYVIINNAESEEGIKLTEIYPTVRGVAVVCTNGNSVAVKEKITSLISSALGIPTNRITVVG